MTISAGWRDLTVPGFTASSMGYGMTAPATVSDATNTTGAAAEEEDGTSASGGAYEVLLDTLSAPHGEVPSLVKTNHWLYGVLCALTFSAYFVSQSEARRRELMDKKTFAFEMIIGWVVRLYNGKCWVLPIVLLSLWFLHSRATKGIWRVGGKLRILYAKETTERIAFDLGNRIQRPGYYPPWASRKIALCVFDNCLVKFNTSYEGSREMGDGSWSYLFINWFVRPISLIDVPSDFDPAAGNSTPR